MQTAEAARIIAFTAWPTVPRPSSWPTIQALMMRPPPDPLGGKLNSLLNIV